MPVMKPTALLVFVVLAIASPCHFSFAEGVPASSESWASASKEKIDKLTQLHKKAEEYIATNQFRDALKVYSDIILLEADDDVAYSNMGHIYMILGDPQRAQNAFLNALDINPSNETAILGLKKIRDPDSELSAPDSAAEETEAVPMAAPETMPTPQIKEPLKEPLVETRPEPPAPEILSREQKIQIALKNAGVYNGRVDGKMGPSTITATRTFQSSRGLAPDGHVGPKTWAALQPYLKIPDKKEKNT